MMDRVLFANSRPRPKQPVASDGVVGRKGPTWPRPHDVLVQCPQCKTIETLQFVGDTLARCWRFSQRDGHVYHDCGSERPCRVHGLKSAPSTF